MFNNQFHFGLRRNETSGLGVAGFGVERISNVEDAYETDEVNEHRWQSAQEYWIAKRHIAQVTSATRPELELPEATYNFEVALEHNYYVGHTGVLVHNLDKIPTNDVRWAEWILQNGSVQPGHAFDVEDALDTGRHREFKPGAPTLNPNKTPIPADAAELFQHAIYDRTADAYYVKNANGTIYKYISSGKGNGLYHFARPVPENHPMDRKVRGYMKAIETGRRPCF